VKEIEQYRDLFINREDAYATQRRGGSYICRKEEVSDQVLVDHLKGRITGGWYCLNKANEIKWACVDADSQDGPTFSTGCHIMFDAEQIRFCICSKPTY